MSQRRRRKARGGRGRRTRKGEIKRKMDMKGCLSLEMNRYRSNYT